MRHRAFLLFWLGAFISNTGNWIENAAQSWAVTSQTRGTAHQGLMVETLQFSDFCPVLLLALFAGVIADRVNRKVWLIILQSAACLLGRRIPDASFLDNLWEAVTAYSHHPDYPAEIEVQPANRHESCSRVFSTDRSTKAL